MDPWNVIGRANIPDSDKQLTLLQCESEFAIRISDVGGDLMNSRVFNSEEELARLACARLKTLDDSHILIGGLGMGFTLAAALKCSPNSTTITVAELIPEVVEWNRGPLGDCAGHPLKDDRTRVFTGDVKQLIDGTSNAFNAILLDVDNGPEAITHDDNNWLYS